jgi:hypothetical protein
MTLLLWITALLCHSRTRDTLSFLYSHIVFCVCREMVIWAVSVDSQTDPNAELLHWVACMHLYQTCYRLPFRYEGGAIRPWVESSPFNYCSCRPSASRTVCREQYIYCPCQRSTVKGARSQAGLVLTEQTDHSSRVDSNGLFELLEDNRAELDGAGAEWRGEWTYSESPPDEDAAAPSLHTHKPTVASAVAAEVTSAATTTRIMWSGNPACDSGTRSHFVSLLLLTDRELLGHFSCFLLHHWHVQGEAMLVTNGAETAGSTERIAHLWSNTV